MAHAVDRDEVQRLVGQGAALIEVLPAEEFEEEHLPRAVSLPLKVLDTGTTAHLERGHPSIVYCWDYQ
jgi:rhodanese-related sulfurtransferase